MKRYAVLVLLILISTKWTSCTSPLKRALVEMQNMPASDYSYIIQPEFKTSKESAESKMKELYSAEEVKIGAVGMHGYDKETKLQKDERFWMKAILLNSKAIEDFKNERKMNELGKEVANTVLSDLKNSEKYDLIQITFRVEWNDGTPKWMNQNIYYKVPSLELTTLF